MHFWGIFGVVWITALGDLPGALVMLYYFKKHGYLRPLRELIGPAFFALGLLVGWPIAVVLADLV
jgi:hypothetical protein